MKITRSQPESLRGATQHRRGGVAITAGLGAASCRMNALLMGVLQALLCWYVKRLERQITQLDPHRISMCS